jgi:hypothetical protein
MRARGTPGGKTLGIHRSEYAALIEWANAAGKRVNFSHIEQFQHVAEGAEHVVYHDLIRGLAIKATHINRFGHSTDGERRSATPLEYLRRLGWHNILFGDDIRIEGIAYEDAQLEVITSQPWIVADLLRPLPTQEEIDAYFEQRHFKKAIINPDAPLYFNADINIVIADAHNRNILREEHEGKLYPIDVVIGRPGSKLHRALCEITETGGKTV